MNPVNKILATGVLAGFTFAALPMVAAAAPAATMQQERAAHPEIVEAIHRLHEAVRALEAARCQHTYFGDPSDVKLIPKMLGNGCVFSDRS